ncbi:MAG: hypothetical protein ACE5PT_05670 [Gemmatimonadales bacterium]
MVARAVRGGVLIVTLAVGGCSSSDRTSDEQQGPDDSHALQETAIAAARITGAQVPSPVGRWTLAPPAGERRPAIQLSIAIDSARSDSLWGRMTHYFAGDMGIDVSHLAPFAGTASADGRVEFAVEWIDGRAPGFAFAGKLAEDTITLTSLKIGPDELVTPGAPRYLVRERS